jgi:O-antigen ligase
MNSNPALTSLWDDIKVTEQDDINLKQRYIEWQAEINLLEERTITGTAAGCINDYRSNSYYRLPKLNTLKAFDQNGLLATSAETGILGLACFCCILLHYLKLAYMQVTTTNRTIPSAAYNFAVANFIGLITACVANLFSSVHYNGILIIFVLVLTLISRIGFLESELKC